MDNKIFTIDFVHEINIYGNPQFESIFPDAELKFNGHKIKFLTSGELLIDEKKINMTMPYGMGFRTTKVTLDNKDELELFSYISGRRVIIILNTDDNRDLQSD